jgi:hypothetical protein
MPAPVCNLTTPQPNGDPRTRPINLQQIPAGATLPQIINIVNNNTRILNSINNANFGTVNNFYQSPSNPTNPRPTLFRPGGLIEVSRVSETVRIENPDDPSQFVEVERINKLRFRDSTNGEQWVWNR